MGGDYWAFYVSGGQVERLNSVQTIGQALPFGLRIARACRGFPALKGFEMTDKTYNGWTNYETWRVKLEIFDGFDPYENFSDDQRYMQDNLAGYLKDYAETLIYEAGGGDGNIAVDYALAFLQAVNWYEIAEHLISDYLKENAEDGAEVEE